MKKEKQKQTLFYKLFFPVVKRVHGKQQVTYAEQIPQDEPVIYVSNHAQAFGPISMIVNFDRKVYPWIAGDIMFKETAPEFVFVQFFSGNIKKHKRWNMLKAKFVAKIMVNVFSNVGGIPVYYDRRLISTFSQSVDLLKQGKSIVIFGETPKKFTPYVAEISDGFVQLAHIYYKQTGKELKFYPVYVAPGHICVGKHVSFDAQAPVKEERSRVATALRDGILEQALQLPAHKPISSYTDEYFEAMEKYNNDKSNHC